MDTNSRRVALAAAAGGVVSVCVATYASRSLAAHDEWDLVVGILIWTALPYLFTGTIYGMARTSIARYACAWGLLGYAAVDLLVRCRALDAPNGSTDSLVTLFVRFWAPAVVVASGALALVAKRVFVR